MDPILNLLPSVDAPPGTCSDGTEPDSGEEMAVFHSSAFNLAFALFSPFLLC